LVLLFQDGTAQINHGGTEMGQGVHSNIREIAAKELGLTIDRGAHTLLPAAQWPKKREIGQTGSADCLYVPNPRSGEPLIPAILLLSSAQFAYVVGPIPISFGHGPSALMMPVRRSSVRGGGFSR